MQKNLELFNYCLTKPEILLEDAYKKGELVITKTKEKKNELIRRNERLIDLITTYKTFGDKLTPKQENSIIYEVIDLLFNTEEKMNYTAFSQYFMVCDLSYSILKNEELKQKHEIIKEILKEYISDRHAMYSSHGYSNIVLQVMSDNYSHKRNCSSGIEKVEKQLRRVGITRYEYGDSIDSNFYLFPDKDEKEFRRFLSAKKIRFEWSKVKQDKIPDIYLQYNRKIYIIEHKHMKEGGGGQSKQDTEIADFVKLTENGVSYITYLDGAYFNKLIPPSPRGKENTLKKDIVSHLQNNANNYFLNTAGFEKFLKEVVIS